MKTYILLLFLLIVSIIPAIAQPYESFFGEEETHVIRFKNIGIFEDFYYDSLSISSSVYTENQLELKKVEAFDSPVSIEPFTTFYLREDISQGKLWLRQEIEGEEVILADLSLEIGENPLIQFNGVGDFEVSDVTFENGKKTIRFSPNVNYNLYNIGSQQLFFKEGVIPFFFGTWFTWG